jgi:hypothetical protein
MNYKYGHNYDRHLIWHLNNRAQEREIKLLPQTHSLEVDYSLFIMVAVLVMLERVDMQPGKASAAFPPRIFAGSTFLSWFLCFSAASSRERLGALYTEIFRSSMSI